MVSSLMAMHPIHPRQITTELAGTTPCDDRNGQPGKALLFDGIDDHISTISIFDFFFQFLFPLAKPTSSIMTYGGVITFRDTFKGYNLYKHENNRWSSLGR